MDNQLPHYLTKPILRPRGKLLERFWTVLEIRDAEAKPGLSQFEVGKLLR
jgi:hypothetical protein